MMSSSLVLGPPDADRLRADLDALAVICDPDLAGWSRPVFSEAYRASREWTRRAMQDAGLEVELDAAGNLVGRLPGHRPGVVATGSHTDTVRGGGRFDGIAGVLSAIEMVRCFRENDIELEHELRVVDFFGEEPNDHGVSCIGSRAISGLVSRDYLDLPDERGRPLGEAIALAGGRPERLVGDTSWQADRLLGFVELHVEQGPVLERERTAIGVVTAIAGIERAVATFTGRPDHAGTMPMRERRDALFAAAEAVLAVEQIGCSADSAVATVGRLESRPGALNIVPSWARLWAEMRSADDGWLGTAQTRLVQQIGALAQRRGVDVEIDWLNDQPAVPADKGVQDLVAEAASAIGYSWRAMPSGAGHDAAHLASLAPMGMIFVPSAGGRSHCPEEWTDPDEIAVGAHVLAQTVLRMDRVVDASGAGR
jgi:N-carbamoyl-L-amino-acid hydrolase